MKFIDCSAGVGLGVVNSEIINHENYYVYEKCRQAEFAEDLLAEMDFCGVDEAFIYHRSMYGCEVTLGNEMTIKEAAKSDRLHPTWAILPPVTETEFAPEIFIPKMKENGVKALRAFPLKNRFFLDRITMGDLIDAMCEKNIPLFLSPQDGWELIFNTLKEFPKLTVIITNYGLWGSDRFFYPLVKAYKNVYIDTSDYQVMNGFQDFCSRFGDERLVFGSNFPMDNHGGPIAALVGSGLPQSSIEKIASGNITRIMSEVNL